MKVVIVDDEPPARAVVRTLLERRSGFEVCGEADDGASAIAMLGRVRPDLVFLDVQLPDLDGFAVLSRLPPEVQPSVVFVTAYDEFAVRAFEVHALDYLVKPFTDARFGDAIDRALRSGSVRASHELGEQTLAPPGHFMVRAGRRSLLVAIAEVDWIEADRYYATLHVGGRTHLVRETMTSLEARLDDRRFVRVHRSAIVNARAVRELVRTPAGALQLVLADGARLDVSRSRRAAVSRLLREL